MGRLSGDEITISNVLIGEVWIGYGNLLLPVER